GGVLLADDRGLDGVVIHRVFGPIDETHQVAVIEVIEAVHLIRHRDRAIEPRHDLCRQFEAKIHPGGPDVKQDVTWRRDSVMLAMDLAKWMQVLRPGRSKEAV